MHSSLDHTFKPKMYIISEKYKKNELEKLLNFIRIMVKFQYFFHCIDRHMNHINNIRFTIIVSGLELEQSSNADFTYSIGQRGCQQLVYDRYTYVKNSVNRQRTIWKCSRKVWFVNEIKFFLNITIKIR